MHVEYMHVHTHQAVRTLVSDLCVHTHTYNVYMYVLCTLHLVLLDLKVNGIQYMDVCLDIKYLGTRSTSLYV